MVRLWDEIEPRDVFKLLPGASNNVLSTYSFIEGLSVVRTDSRTSAHGHTRATARICFITGARTRAHRCCQNIAMMAALLEACGQYPSLKSGVAAKTGQIISEDIEIVCAVLRRLEDELARP
jgi:ribosomal protein L32